MYTCITHLNHTDGFTAVMSNEGFSKLETKTKKKFTPLNNVDLQFAVEVLHNSVGCYSNVSKLFTWLMTFI